ncbi:MAG: Hsp20/alpha crystallin family protein [Deltaproteobacteria bacterium]|nr:Hsp20/alpha crystallin family protein [Deltaproteobacteria bacterium]
MFDDLTIRHKRDTLQGGSWEPPVDAFENEKEIVVEAEIPGTTQKNIEIRLEDNILIIKGVRNMDENALQGNFYRMERMYGSFIRTFTLPDLVDKEKISASYKNGVLTVRMPKRRRDSITIEVK